VWTVVPYLVPLGIVVAANLGVTRRGWRSLTYLSLALLSLLAWSAGLFLVVGSWLLRAGQQAEIREDVASMAPYGIAIVVTGLLSFLCLLPAVRRLLARALPIDPDSPVHATALVLSLYLAATSLSLFLIPTDTMLDSFQSTSLGSGALVSGQVVMLLFALAGVGLGTRRNVRQTLQRLGVRWPTLRQLLLAGGLILGFLVLDYTVAVLWQRLWPGQYQRVMEGNERLFSPFASFAGAIVLGLSAGIGEETLFRGALQPRLRIPLTALLFTVGHVQYALSPALVEILIIGLVLGWLRERTNTTTCMLTHAGYNFLDAILMQFFP